MESPADINEDYVRRVIRREENPDPMYIVYFTVATCILMYYLYIIVIKACIGGTWYSDLDDGAFKIHHNIWNDTVFVYISGEEVMRGHISGGAINLSSRAGIEYMGVVQGNKIYWAGSNITWQRPRRII